MTGIVSFSEKGSAGLDGRCSLRSPSGQCRSAPPPMYAKRCPGRRRGLVLLLVTIVIAMISLAAYGFVARMQAEYKAAHLQGERLQADCVAASAIEQIAALLELPRQERQSAGGMALNPDLFQSILVDGSHDDPWQGRFSIISPGKADGSSPRWHFGVEDESTKLNLATLLEWERRAPGAGRAALLQLPAMTNSIADALLDWIDPDEVPRDYGAEADFYLGQNPPTQTANRPPSVIEELLMVKGVTRQLLLGTDSNLDYRPDARDPALADSDRAAGTMATTDVRPLAHYLTLYSAERNEDQLGQARIFVNDTNLTRLYQQLIERFPVEWANYIVAYRQHGPYTGSESGKDTSEIAVDFAQPAKVLIDSSLDLVGTKVRVGSAADAPVIASPLADGAASYAADLPRLCDGVTTVPDHVLRGRVNISLASREVLLAIPAVDESLAERIVATRGTSRAQPHGRTHAVWLLVEGLVDLAKMKQLLPHVTPGGDVARAQIISCYGTGSPWSRWEVVVDGTQRPARTAYFRDLRRLGQAFSTAQLMPDIPAIQSTTTNGTEEN